MKRDPTQTLRYRIAKKRITKLMEAQKIDSVSVSTEKKSRLTVHLKVGEPLIFRGNIVDPLRKFIFKNG